MPHLPAMVWAELHNYEMYDEQQEHHKFIMARICSSSQFASFPWKDHMEDALKCVRCLLIKLRCWRLNTIDLPQNPIQVSTLAGRNAEIMTRVFGDGWRSSMAAGILQHQPNNVQLRIKPVFDEIELLYQSGPPMSGSESLNNTPEPSYFI